MLRPMRLLAPFLLLAAAVLIALQADRPRPRADVVFAQRSDIFTLDPQRMSYQQDLRMAAALYETLVTLDPDDCSFDPGVAERWEVSDDGRTYTFHLRDDARWSNGDPVLASDFLYAWRRALLPDSAADYSGLFMNVEGAPEFFAWRQQALAEFANRPSPRPEDADALWTETERRFRETVGFETPNPHAIVVRLSKPVPYFLDLVAFPVFSPVHEASVSGYTSLDAASGRVMQKHGWTKPGKLVSNGPYRLVEWRYKRDMRLERNEHYWNREQVPSDSIETRVLEDANTVVLACDSGAIDWVTDVLVEYRADMLAQRRAYLERHRAEFERLRSEGLTVDEAVAALPPPGPGERRNIRGFDAFGTDFFSFNCRPELPGGRFNPFKDARVRRAFALAVDKQLLVERVTRLNERVSGTLVPPGSIPGYASPAGLPFDPERARAELADAGWSDRDGDGLVEDAEGRRFPTVDLLYSSGSPRYKNISLALRDLWRATLGVEVDLREKEGKLYKDDLKGGNFMVARGGWYGDYGDPTTFLDLARSTDGNNDRGYRNPDYDAMLDAAADETDPARRLVLLSEAERFLVEEAVPMLPICQYLTIYMYDPTRLEGLTEHPRLEQELGRLRVRGTP